LREAIDALASRMLRQAAWCAKDGSPLYGSLLEKAAHDLEVEGPVWEVLRGYEGEPGSSAVALRFMAAVHRLVLDDSLPELASCYPSTGGVGDAHSTWPVFRQALIDHRDRIHALVSNRCQTNEVGRSAALLGGFLEVAHRTGLPLRILEIGASAGLNLRWDRYRYESPDGAWGGPGSKVTFTRNFDVPPPMNRTAEVAERRGCDVNPIDPTTDEGRLTLRSAIWADQLGRMALLDGAIEIASEMPVEVEGIDAVSFLERELARPVGGAATVVYHSVFMQYVAEPDQKRIEDVIVAARVFHLTLEPAENVLEIRLDGELLGTSRPHGTHVRWNVDSSQL
jgi:hypothetical protein